MCLDARSSCQYVSHYLCIETVAVLFRYILLYQKYAKGNCLFNRALHIFELLCLAATSNQIFYFMYLRIFRDFFLSLEWNSKYFVIFINDYSRKLFNIYINFIKIVKTDFSKTIKTFLTDNTIEYKNTLYFFGGHNLALSFNHFASTFHY